jgi:GntR family transcriptional regulator
MESPPTAGTVPIHHQIADSLRARIESGDLEPGDPIPTTEDLRKQWRCSTGSARRALDVLKSEGRVTGGRGRPAVVREPPRRIRLSPEMSQTHKDMVLRPKGERELVGAIELTSGLSIKDVISTHDYDTTPATSDLAEEFSIKLESPLSRRVYEMTDPRTGIRLSWSISYIPLSLIDMNPALLDESNEPWPGGHHHQLYTVGIEIDKFIRSVIAIEPSPGERQKWGIESGVPLLRVRSRSVDTNGRIVEISDATYPADRTEIVFTEQLTRWPPGHAKYEDSGE